MEYNCYMIIFQVSPEDVTRSSTLDKNDIGKWCFTANGCVMGFFDTRDEAEDALSRRRVHHMNAEYR
ncbi:MAG: hypothetical protein EBR82_00060 [Caulobacteraceae bacterium]|nr:hypothetical protein [Caulobacteraceae bacterium]